MDISVLIVVRNEQANILDLLRSLEKQELKPKEILLIDHLSEDQTFSMITKYKERHPQMNLSCWQRSTNHLGRSRQELLPRAQSQLVAFIDGDCVAPKNWLKKLHLEYLRLKDSDSHIVGVGGPNRLPTSTEIHEAINFALDGFNFLSPQVMRPQNALKVDHLPTTNCMFDKTALYTVGGFSPEFALAGEDLDLGQRLTRKGYSLYLTPNPIVVNKCADNFMEWLQRLKRFGHVQAQFYDVRRWRAQSLYISATLLPLVVTLLLLALVSPFLRNLMTVYLLLSLVTILLWTGVRGKMRLATHVWMAVHLSPLAYSFGFWQYFATKPEKFKGLKLRLEQTMTYISAHLKPMPAHVFRLLVGMRQRFR